MPRQYIQNNRLAVNRQSATASAVNGNSWQGMHRADIRHRSRGGQCNRGDVSDILKR